jgi:hypothetical protein
VRAAVWTTAKCGATATLLPSRTDDAGRYNFRHESPARLASHPFRRTDPAVRADWCDLAEQINATQFDPDTPPTSRDLTPTPFARCWEIEAWFPFQLKRLRTYLRQRGIGRVTVKKRGSPLEPEALIHDLRLEGELERVLVLTHLNGEPIVLICSALVN